MIVEIFLSEIEFCLLTYINLSITLNVEHISSHPFSLFWYLKTYLSLMKNNYTFDSLGRLCKQKIEMFKNLSN